MRAFLIILGFIVCVNVFPSGFVQNQSRDLVYKYFDRPDLQTIKQEVKGNSIEIETCGDECDLFIMPDKTHSSEMWDVIVLFYAFLSESNGYEDFRLQHAEYSRDLLRQYAMGPCLPYQEEGKRARCAVARVARRIGLKYAFVRYDEGARCKAFKQFDNLSYVVGGGCDRTKAK